MLMLPATNTRPKLLLKDCLIPKFLLTPDLELLLDGIDIGKRRQSGLVAEALDLIGRSRARKLEMVLPAFRGIVEIRKHVSAMKYVTGAIGIDHTLACDWQRRELADRARLVVPQQALFTMWAPP